MNEAPAINQNSHSGAPTARSLTAGLISPVAALADELSRQTQDNGHNALPSGEWNANRSSLDSFTAPFTPQASELGSSFATTAVKPMPPASVVDLVGLSIDRMQDHGNSRVELQLSLEGGGSVSIELQFRDGAVHAAFNTDSAELREALQQGWSQLANRSETLGMPLAAPVFKSPATAFANAGQQDFRDHHGEPQSKQEPPPASYGTPHQSKRISTAINPARRTNSGLNLWA
jgi:hypothetical protein